MASSDTGMTTEPSALLLSDTMMENDKTFQIYSPSNGNQRNVYHYCVSL